MFWEGLAFTKNFRKQDSKSCAKISRVYSLICQYYYLLITLANFASSYLSKIHLLQGNTSYGSSSIFSLFQLPLCSVVIERSIFPIIILKYLIVLCVLTAAYILLAYIIEYCIRHWFPPSDRDEVMDRNRSLVESA